MQNSETKTCQNCKQDFTIEPEDFDFYKKISVPSPTFCPGCRLQRRLIWRGERSLYKRNCDLCGSSIISIYSKDKPYKIYCRECYHSDNWNPLDYGAEIDFSKPFFQQYRELQLKVPRIYAFIFQNVNSDYVNGAAYNKNCYLIFVSDHNEDSMYSYSILECRRSMDLLNCNECELSYESISCRKCYKVYFSQDCNNSTNLYFCKNCANCQDCIGSVNLRNAKYQIFNKQYSKEEYAKALESFRLDSRLGIEETNKKARELWGNFPSKYIHGLQNVNVVGDYVFNSKNSFHVYDSTLLEDSKFVNHGSKAKSCYDGYVVVDNSQNSYEIVSAISLNNVKSGYCLWNGFYIEYSDTCENSNNLFRCVGLRKKQYCILNKQYTKEEYEKLVTKIINHMNDMPYADASGKKYGYGEYFPHEFCPFAYNETVSQEYFPLTKEKSISMGFGWKDSEEKNYKITLPSKDIPDSEFDAQITNEILGCAHEGKCDDGCTVAFRLTPAEIQFYDSAGLPIPNLCSNCRHWRRLKMRNPLRLYNSSCSCLGEDSSNGSM